MRNKIAAEININRVREWMKPGPLISVFVLIALVMSMFLGLDSSQNREAFQATVSGEHEEHMAELKLIKQAIQGLK